MSALTGPLRASLGAKLPLAQMLVVIAGSLTLAVVALAAAPGVFHTHVRMPLGTIPPETARTHTPGSGGNEIGLTITRAIVHARGGQIHAESHGPGRGARFVITLPAAHRP